MVNAKISDQDICLRGSGGWVWSRVGERVMGCRWNRWPIRFHPLTIHLSIEEVTIKGYGVEIKQSWTENKTHSSGTPVFPELTNPSCLSMCGLGGLAVRGCQSLFQTIDGALRGGSVSPPTFAFATTDCIRHSFVHFHFLYSVLLVFTLTHRHIVLSLFSCIKDVKSQILFWNACVFQQLYFNYRFLTLQCQLRLLILNEVAE